MEKALKLFGTTVQIVNLSWLCELYMGLTAPLNDSGNRRFNVNTNVPLEVGPVTLSKFHENIGRMMGKIDFFKITKSYYYFFSSLAISFNNY